MNEEKHSLKITSKIWSSARFVAAFTFAQLPLTNTHAKVSINPRGLNCDIIYIYVHSFCMREVKAPASLLIWADSPEPSLRTGVVSTLVRFLCIVLVVPKFGLCSMTLALPYHTYLSVTSLISCIDSCCADKRCLISQQLSLSDQRGM